MAKITEKRLYKVEPQAFTSNGTSFGALTIADSCVFVVGHIVIIKSNTQPSIILKVKRIPNATTILVGEEKSPIYKYEDISAYLAADGATIESVEQNRPSVPEQEIERLTYDEEPVIARRVSLIDKHGDKISESNPLPVSATIVPTTVGTPSLFNVVCPTAGTEYSQLIPNNTTQLQLKVRNNAKLQLAWIPGTTMTNFLTLTPGMIYVLESVKLTSKTVYFTSSKDDTVVEILSWA